MVSPGFSRFLIYILKTVRDGAVWAIGYNIVTHLFEKKFNNNDKG